MKYSRGMFFFSVILQLFIPGCAMIKRQPIDATFKSNEYKVFTNEEIEAETSAVTDAIVEAIKSGDADAIEKVYCEETKEKHDIKNEAESLFQFIDGDVIEIQNSYAGISSSTYYKDYGDIELFYSGRIEGIKTDTEKTYEIGFYGYFYYRDHDEKKGVSTIYAFETNGNAEDGSTETGFRVGDE